jgi:signal transduction histidine kinase
VLKHRASALGLLDDPSAGASGREEIRRLLLEPVPASLVVTGAYERLQRAAGAAGIVLRPLEREPVFGPLVATLARVETLLERSAGRDATGASAEIAALDRQLRERHVPGLARLAAAAPRTRLDPAEVAGWMRRLAPAGAAGRPQPGLHLPALDVELPLTSEALHTILSNLVRNAMAAVAEAGARGGEARVLVRLEEERDAVGRRMVTLLVADSSPATLALEDIERRDGQRGLGIVRDLVRRWGGHLVVRPERPPLTKAIGASFPRAVDPAPVDAPGDPPAHGRQAVGGGS